MHIIPRVFIFDGEIKKFFYAIATSIIAASIFYLFQVFIPERRRKRIVKENFKLNYTQFKEECISIFLAALGFGYNSELSKKLMDLKNFKMYFQEDFKEGQNKWDGVLNGLNDALLKNLSVQFEILSQEIDFFLNNVSLHDKEVFAFLKRLKIATYSLKNTSPDYDEMKTFSGFIWELFAGWSFISGYRKNDIFEEMVEGV